MPKSLHYGPEEIRAQSTIHFEDIPVNAYNKTVQEERANFKDEDLVRIYRDITILREFESMLTSIKTQSVYNGVETTYPGPAHLSVGQEAACVGQAYLMTPNDYQFGSHRSHSEILAKSLSSIQKLSDDELMKIMEGFLGGSTLRAVEKMGKCDSVKELAIRFILYGALSEIFARKTGFHMGMAAPCTPSSCPSACIRTTPSSAVPRPSRLARRCIRRSTTKAASSCATSATVRWAAAPSGKR